MSDDQQAAIEIAGLSKTYGSFTAVRDFDLSVEPGEFITLLGPSGSGKTSVLMMVAGFVPPSSGDVRVNGRSIVSLAPHERDMGVVFQNYALFPHRSVAENVGFPLRMRKVAKHQVQERVKSALDLVGLRGLADRRPHQLSGGQQQRVALARALVFEPPVLLMDEPLGALDRKLREQLQVEIKSIQRRVGVTVLFVTHDQGEALGMSHRIAIMSDGELVQLGPPDQLYDRPANTYVASFLGEANLIAGTRDGVDEMLSDAGLRVRADLLEHDYPEGVVVIRPQRIAVNPDTDGFDNDYVGKVEEAIYGGHTTRLTVNVHGHSLIAYTGGAETSDAPRIGDQVRLAWRARDAVVVERDDTVGSANRTVTNAQN